MRRPTIRRRLVGLALALCVHLVVLLLLRTVAVREAKLVKVPERRVTIALQQHAPVPRPVPRPEPIPVVTPPTPHKPHDRVDEQATPPAPPQETASAPSSAHDDAASTDAPSLARDQSESKIERVVRGADSGPAPSLKTLEDASGIAVPGPESDLARTTRLSKQGLLADLAFHDVARGLADDWFHRRRSEMERTWHPQPQELNDGGKEVRAEELLARTMMNPLLWNDAAHDIAGDASAVADTFSGDRASALAQMSTHLVVPGETDAQRRTRIRAMMTEHKGAFKTTVGLEVTARHRADGSIEAIDIVIRSGHAQLDAGAVDALARVFALNNDDKAPDRVGKGRPFQSHWALTATWELNVPKCSYMQSGTNATSQLAQPGGVVPVGCGTSFGNDGVDVPFTVKKVTHVELIAVERL